jgi:hypothetical protein
VAAFIVHSVARAPGEYLEQALERAMNQADGLFRTPVLASSVEEAAAAFLDAHGGRAHPVNVLPDSLIDSMVDRARALVGADETSLERCAVVMTIEPAYRVVPNVPVALEAQGAPGSQSIGYVIVLAQEFGEAARLGLAASPGRVLAGVVPLSDLMDDLLSMDRLSQRYLSQLLQSSTSGPH